MRFHRHLFTDEAAIGFHSAKGAYPVLHLGDGLFVLSRVIIIIVFIVFRYRILIHYIPFMFAAIATGALPLHQCVRLIDGFHRGALRFLYGANFAAHIAYMRYNLFMQKRVDLRVFLIIILAQRLPLMFASIR